MLCAAVDCIRSNLNLTPFLKDSSKWFALIRWFTAKNFWNFWTALKKLDCIRKINRKSFKNKPGWTAKASDQILQTLCIWVYDSKSLLNTRDRGTLCWSCITDVCKRPDIISCCRLCMSTRGWRARVHHWRPCVDTSDRDYYICPGLSHHIT